MRGEKIYLKPLVESSPEDIGASSNKSANTEVTAEQSSSSSGLSQETKNPSKGIINKTKQAGKWIAYNFREVKDLVKSTSVNMSAIRENKEFTDFLEKLEMNNLDWGSAENKSKIREAYVSFERYQNTAKIYTELFDNKIINLDTNLGSNKDNIESRLFDMLKNNPDELRRLEKHLLKAKESEIKIFEAQKKIDVYKSKGGKEGIDMQIATLQKAQSWKSMLLKTLGRDTILGWGEEYSNAYKKAKSEYGISDKTNMMELIKASKVEIKNIKVAEKEKDKIKDKYKKQREEVFNKNEIAKFIHSEIENKLREKINDIASIKDINQLKEAQKFVTGSLMQFAEGGKEAQLGKISSVELKKYQVDLEKQLESVLEDFLRKEIDQTSKNNLDDQVKKHIKQAEFAGISKKDSMKKVLETFIKIKENLKEKGHEKMDPLSRAIENSKILLA